MTYILRRLIFLVLASALVCHAATEPPSQDSRTGATARNGSGAVLH
jgi:hypothetical protein